MKQENSCYLSEKFNCKPPLLFVLPLDDYSDEIKRQRDKEWFLKCSNWKKNRSSLEKKWSCCQKNIFFNYR